MPPKGRARGGHQNEHVDRSAYRNPHDARNQGHAEGNRQKGQEKGSSKDSRPSSVAYYYNSRIADFARNGDVAGVEEQFCKMQEEGVRPTRCTFNSIINAHKVRSDMVSAEEWVHRLLEAGVKPSVVTYTTMISGFAQAGDIVNANKWFKLLIDAGCQPTEHTHNAIVYAHCQAGDLPAAEECLHAYLASPDLKSHPSIVAFNTIIHACGRLGRSDKAIYWFHEAVRRGLVPSNSTFCAVLNAFAEVGAFAEIEKYSALMATYGLPVADISHRALIKVCTHQGDYMKAEQLFEQILEHGESAVSTFNTMIHACTQTGDIESAERYFRIMEEKGVKPCIVTYNTIINACAGLGDTDRAEQWLMRMVQNEVMPNEVTYGTLCKAFARQGGVEKVKRILVVLQESGYSLNEYFFASLISACGVSQPPDVATAEEAFEDFARRGFKPQRVRRVLARVVGERRAAQLLSNIMRTTPSAGQASRPRAARVLPGTVRNGATDRQPPRQPVPYLHEHDALVTKPENNFLQSAAGSNHERNAAANLHRAVASNAPPEGSLPLPTRPSRRVGAQQQSLAPHPVGPVTKTVTRGSARAALYDHGHKDQQLLAGLAQIAAEGGNKGLLQSVWTHAKAPGALDTSSAHLPFNPLQLGSPEANLAPRPFMDFNCDEPAQLENLQALLNKEPGAFNTRGYHKGNISDVYSNEGGALDARVPMPNTRQSPSAPGIWLNEELANMMAGQSQNTHNMSTAMRGAQDQQHHAGFVQRGQDLWALPAHGSQQAYPGYSAMDGEMVRLEL